MVPQSEAECGDCSALEQAQRSLSRAVEGAVARVGARELAYGRFSCCSDCADVTLDSDRLASQARTSVSAAKPRQIQLVWASDFRGTDGAGLQWLCAWRVPALPPAGPAQAAEQREACQGEHDAARRQERPCPATHAARAPTRSTPGIANRTQLFRMDHRLLSPRVGDRIWIRRSALMFGFLANVSTPQTKGMTSAAGNVSVHSSRRHAAAVSAGSEPSSAWPPGGRQPSLWSFR